MSRAGTTSLVAALNKDERVIAFGESLFWGRNWLPPASDGGYDVSEVETVINRLSQSTVGAPNLAIKNDIDKVNKLIQFEMSEGGDALIPPSDLFRIYADAIAESADRLYGVEKTPHHIMHIDRILTHAPDCRIVAMVRHPRDWLNSYKAQGARKEVKVRKLFSRLYHPLIASLVCRGFLRSVIEEKSKPQDNVLILSLEEFSDAPDVQLSKVRHHLLLPRYEDKQIIPIENSSFPSEKKDVLTWVDDSILYYLCKKESVDLGYGLEKPPLYKVGVFLSILTIPVYLFRNFNFLMAADTRGISGFLSRYIRRK